MPNNFTTPHFIGERNPGLRGMADYAARMAAEPIGDYDRRTAGDMFKDLYAMITELAGRVATVSEPETTP
ncbi:MAG TPA: hypothetical protein VMY35_16145 [Phycisphaerae bacterium]|nr:hypothetical protein [Phycisphaerae bacterium]